MKMRPDYAFDPRSDGFGYRQIAREGDAAIYEQKLIVPDADAWRELAQLHQQIFCDRDRNALFPQIFLTYGV
jgi:hypothetical protein